VESLFTTSPSPTPKVGAAFNCLALFGSTVEIINFGRIDFGRID
jgi:hypothetical protein